MFYPRLLSACRNREREERCGSSQSGHSVSVFVCFSVLVTSNSLDRGQDQKGGACADECLGVWVRHRGRLRFLSAILLSRTEYLDLTIDGGMGRWASSRLSSALCELPVSLSKISKKLLRDSGLKIADGRYMLMGTTLAISKPQPTTARIPCAIARKSCAIAIRSAGFTVLEEM